VTAADTMIRVDGVTKRFSIPSVSRQTVREHVLNGFRPRSHELLTVLDDITFRVGRGETLGVMGRNGSGKSTLLRIIAGIYLPDAGQVVVSGGVTPILELGVGFNHELTALDNVYLLGTVMGLSRRQVRSALDEILDFAELRRFAHQKVQHFSSGMLARLGYAVAFTAVRDILILDEIFAVGDASFKARCEDRYWELAEAGRTILVVSHDPAAITRMCRRAVLIEGGRIVLDDDASAVANAYVRLLA
jgi:ABC-type polysaccharide/polyol phosphate transport system ATPase subunit